ncbi:hypothetical protein [Mycobacterium sp.]|uniref:hypothetical protein n=1 Tax=Mycobacterium sp. TaxID=1785 RepID=UPI003F9C1ECF
MTTTNPPVRLGELLEATVAALVRQLDDANERIRTLEAELSGVGHYAPYPVDSTTRHCCGAIGGHAPECEKAELSGADR